MALMTPLSLAIAVAVLLFAASSLILVQALHSRHHTNSATRLAALLRPAMGQRSAGTTARLMRQQGARLIGEEQLRQTQALLHSAGLHHPEGAVLFVLLRLALAAAAAGLGLWLSWSRPDAIWVWPVFGGLSGWLLPRTLLALLAMSRQARLRKEMSFVCDLMRLVLESGLSLDQCLRYVAAASPRTSPCLSHGLQLLIADIDKGMAYQAALERWGERLGIPEGRELAAVFQQSLAYGTELTPLLRAFALDWAERRVVTAREAAGRKASYLTAVMVLFFMPPLMVLVIAPAMASAKFMWG